MILHAKHAASSHQDIVIKSPDTDVAILALTHHSIIGAMLYFLTGIKNSLRIIKFQSIIDTLSNDVCEALIGLHTFTGCDSVSSFHGKSKEKAFSVVLNDDNFSKAFSQLGKDFSIEENTLKTLETVVCRLYGQDVTSVNEARYCVFQLNPKSTEQSLPPTADALKLHTLRANYQAAVHRRAIQQYICAPSPVGHGWNMEDGLLVVNWMENDPAPKDVLMLISCKCKTDCSSKRCSCKSSNLYCTDLCKCKKCQNISKKSDNEYVDCLEDSDDE